MLLECKSLLDFFPPRVELRFLRLISFLVKRSTVRSKVASAVRGLNLRSKTNSINTFGMANTPVTYAIPIALHQGLQLVVIKARELLLEVLLQSLVFVIHGSESDPQALQSLLARLEFSLARLDPGFGRRHCPSACVQG